MKSLITSIITALRNAITAGDINATTVYKGFQEMPAIIPYTAYPYIAIDDGGERVEDNSAAETQTRYYSIVVEMGIQVINQETSLDEILDLSDEVKTTLEKETNRFLDGHAWGISITPYIEQGADKNFYRGRRVIIDYFKLEDNYGEY
jgi:hypothetical protein